MNLRLERQYQISMVLANRAARVAVFSLPLGLAILFVVSGCSARRQLTAVPSTETPVPTATPAPVQWIPRTQVGARFVYADGSTLVAVPLGSFTMGHGTADNPAHTVTLSDYWIYSTEVTNQQYRLCVESDACTPPDPTKALLYASFEGANLPVVGITYDQAADYCRAYGGKLPTEAQWERAAGSTSGGIYPWGIADPSCELANTEGCVRKPLSVGSISKGASAFGMLDAAGNVFEWTRDWYDPRYYESSPVGDPLGPLDGKARVIRSSSYRSAAQQIANYARTFASPRTVRDDLGFRCVVADPAAFAPSCTLPGGIDPAQLGSVRFECPNVAVETQSTDCRYGGGATVVIKDDRANDPAASFGGIVGCTLLSGTPGVFPISYRCLRTSTVEISSSCSYAGIGDAVCPTHYAWSSTESVCRWDGSRTTGFNCPAGTFLDPIAHCCSAIPGLADPVAVCPVGELHTTLGDGTSRCLPSAVVAPPPRASAKVAPPVCPGLCSLSAEICALDSLVFCRSTCSCLPIGRKCP